MFSGRYHLPTLCQFQRLQIRCFMSPQCDLCSNWKQKAFKTKSFFFNSMTTTFQRNKYRYQERRRYHSSTLLSTMKCSKLSVESQPRPFWTARRSFLHVSRKWARREHGAIERNKADQGQALRIIQLTTRANFSYMCWGRGARWSLPQPCRQLLCRRKRTLCSRGFWWVNTDAQFKLLFHWSGSCRV